jgi:hypothetical protein
VRLNRNLHMHGRMRVDGHSDGAGIDTNARRQRLEMECAKKDRGHALRRLSRVHVGGDGAYRRQDRRRAKISLPVLMGAATMLRDAARRSSARPTTSSASCARPAAISSSASTFPRSGIDVAAFLHAREHLSIKSSRDRMPE